jgi:hypothetical protein
MTFLHCLKEIKEMEVGGTTSCILHNFFSKVTITLRGLDNITKFNERNITQYLVFEGIDVVGQATLLVDAEDRFLDRAIQWCMVVGVAFSLGPAAL